MQGAYTYIDTICERESAIIPLCLGLIDTICERESAIIPLYKGLIHI